MSLDVSTKQGLMRHLIEVHEVLPHRVRMEAIEDQHLAIHHAELCDHAPADISYPVDYESHEE
jgi:hypothetical protein